MEENHWTKKKIAWCIVVLVSMFTAAVSFIVGAINGNWTVYIVSSAIYVYAYVFDGTYDAIKYFANHAKEKQEN